MSYQLLAKTASLLGVQGKIQSKDGVVHLIVEGLFQPQVRMAVDNVQSRDFR